MAENKWLNLQKKYVQNKQNQYRQNKKGQFK